MAAAPLRMHLPAAPSDPMRWNRDPVGEGRSYVLLRELFLFLRSALTDCETLPRFEPSWSAIADWPGVLTNTFPLH